ncbi:DMT family transporter [Sporosarcina aquimarina]|uniref:DMT family transporter n=1 Tax=Sporosarcina aquimarina TaxID=114975 RepID=UPI001C8E7A75|nr:DMT family transporter [Sporosarcina aquimarina]MBY0223161.1 DMT family transporter [Sporosarcina aquimarina]
MKNIKVFITLILVMFIWGVNVSALKFLVNYFSPITITSIRILTASSLVFIILFILKIIRLPRKKEWLYVFGGAITSVAAHHYFLSEGLTKTSAANGGLILGLGPLLTAVLSVLILKEKVTMIRFVGFLFGGIGVSVIVLAGSKTLGEISIGDIEIFVAIVSQAFSFILIKKASETMDPRLLTGYMFFIGSLILLLIALVKEPNGFSELSKGNASVWLIFLFSALLATAVGHMIYNSAIEKIGAARSSIFLNLNTFFSLIGAGLFLGEAILLVHFVGLTFIIAGVLLGSGSLETLLRSTTIKQEQTDSLQADDHKGKQDI